MTVRITTRADQNGVLVRIDGWLQRADVDELLGLLGTLQRPVALDLTDLQSLDRDVVGVLRDLLDVDVELRATSPYIELLLRAERGP